MDEQPAVGPWGSVPSQPSGAAERAVQVSLLPGKDVAVPVRFGGEASRPHGLVLRFGPMEYDGRVPGHLVARTARGLEAARDIIAWDPVLLTFAWGDMSAMERIAERLDPLSALTGSVAHGVMAACNAAGAVLNEMLRPGFIVIGGLGAILFAYVLYYLLWIYLAKVVLLFLVLPGVVVAVGCLFVRHQRLERLRVALHQAAWHALDPEAYYAPR